MTKSEIAIALYKEIGSLTGGLLPDFKADLDALENGQGFTEHSEKVFEAFKGTLAYSELVNVA